MMNIHLFDIVVVKEEIEASPLSFVKPSVLGTVIDKTVPNYCLVKFSNGQLEWLDAKHLKKYNEMD